MKKKLGNTLLFLLILCLDKWGAFQAKVTRLKAEVTRLKDEGKK